MKRRERTQSRLCRKKTPFRSHFRREKIAKLKNEEVRLISFYLNGHNLEEVKRRNRKRERPITG